MADISTTFCVRRLTPGTVVATAVPIVPPYDCNQIVVENQDAAITVTVFSDVSDPTNTGKRLGPGLELTLRSTAHEPAFLAGRIYGYVMADSGAPVACVSFLR